MLDPNSYMASDFFARTEKLEKADPDESLEIRALILHLCGDLDGALVALGQRTHQNKLRDLVLLTNYSKCAAAQEIYTHFCSPRSGHFWSNVHFAWPIGAFHQIASFAREAEKMHLKSTKAVDLEEIYMIDELLNELGVTDSDAAKVMGVAGSVLAAHGLMFMGSGPEVEIIGSHGEKRAVHLTYRLATTATEAVSTYLEFIEQLFHQELDMPPGFHISFGGCAA